MSLLERTKIAFFYFNFFKDYLPQNEKHFGKVDTVIVGSNPSTLEIMFVSKLYLSTVKLGYNEQLRTGYFCSL